MRFLLLPTSILLCSCSVRQTPAIVPEVRSSVSTTYASPDGRIYAAIRRTGKPLTVALIERSSGRILGVAESSVTLDPDGDHMEGSIRATYSDDLSTVVIHEDFSDASPNPRYILFQRRPGAATYFAPPIRHVEDPGEFDFDCATILQVTREALTLGYPDWRSRRVIPIADLLKTRTPKSSMEWSDVDYAKYE